MISGEGAVTLSIADIHALSLEKLTKSELLTLLVLMCNEIAPNVYSAPQNHIARTINTSVGTVKNNLSELVSNGVVIRNQRGFCGNCAEFRLSESIKEVRDD